MEVRDLAILRILQETRNITHAADRLYMAQSAVSKRVKAIERELGVVLLLRSRHGVRFTPAGEAVLRYEKAAGSQLEQLHQELSRLQQGAAEGTLRVGAVTPYALGRLPLRWRPIKSARLRWRCRSSRAQTGTCSSKCWTARWTWR